MSETIEQYFIRTNDAYAPAVFKEELAQYDNYQIYNLYCIDLDVEVKVQKLYPGHPEYLVTNTTKPVLLNCALAVQAVDPRSIDFSFDQLVQQYPSTL
jgi:hypothetical protein